MSSSDVYAGDGTEEELIADIREILVISERVVQEGDADVIGGLHTFTETFCKTETFTVDIAECFRDGGTIPSQLTVEKDGLTMCVRFHSAEPGSPIEIGRASCRERV